MPPDAYTILPNPFILAFLFLALPMAINSLQCFECFDRTQPCNASSNCSGSACVLYENMSNRTSVAFCLLATAEREDSQMVEGCWRDGADSSGVECLCTRNFCNAPRDPWTSDPNRPPIEGLKMLDKNPFVDYEYLEEEKAMQKEGNGKNEIGELMDDPELPSEGDEQDLMPKDFDDYLDWERRTLNRNQITKGDDENNQTEIAISHSSATTTIWPTAEESSSQQPINAQSTFSPVENSASPNHRWPHSVVAFVLSIIISSITINFYFYSPF